MFYYNTRAIYGMTKISRAMWTLNKYEYLYIKVIPIYKLFFWVLKKLKNFWNYSLYTICVKCPNLVYYLL